VKNLTFTYFLFFKFLNNKKVGKMSKKRIIKALRGLGLSLVDAQVYIFLANSGPNTEKEIVENLQILEEKIYHSLNSLQDIEIVKTSGKPPIKYSAVPFEEVLDIFIEVKKEQTKTMQENREEFLSSWRETIKKEIAKT
jgi:sugar-specific transcriptional regulator TrmB